MSTKPTIVPRWATDLTNNTAPSSGQQDTGWTLSQVDVSSYDNWFKYYVYLWCLYLDDGEVTFDVSVTTPDVIASVSVTAPVIFHTDGIKRKIPVTTVLRGSAGAQLNTSGGVIAVGTNTERFIYSIPMAEGETLTGWSVHINDTSGGTATTAKLHKMNANTQVESVVGSIQTSSQSGHEELINTGLSELAADTDSYYIVVWPGGSSGLNLYHGTYTVTKAG